MQTYLEKDRCDVINSRGSGTWGCDERESRRKIQQTSARGAASPPYVHSISVFSRDTYSGTKKLSVTRYHWGAARYTRGLHPVLCKYTSMRPNLIQNMRFFE